MMGEFVRTLIETTVSFVFIGLAVLFVAWLLVAAFGAFWIEKKRWTTYAHLVCGHVRPCDPATLDGQLLACYRCGVPVKVEAVREAVR